MTHAYISYLKIDYILTLAMPSLGTTMFVFVTFLNVQMLIQNHFEGTIWYTVDAYNSKLVYDKFYQSLYLTRNNSLFLQTLSDIEDIFHPTKAFMK